MNTLALTRTLGRATVCRWARPHAGACQALGMQRWAQSLH